MEQMLGPVVGGFCRFEGLQSDLADAFEVGDAVGAEDEAGELGEEVVEFAALAQIGVGFAFRAGGVVVVDGAGFCLAIGQHRPVAVAALAPAFGVETAVAAHEAAIGDDDIGCVLVGCGYGHQAPPVWLGGFDRDYMRRGVEVKVGKFTGKRSSSEVSTIHEVAR